MNFARTRAGTVAGQIVGDIVSGKYPPGSRLPTELELCEATGVSRATLREAMKSLQQLGVTSIEQGRGSFVNPTESWSPFEPTVLAARVEGAAADSSDQWEVQLAEARRVVEVDVAGLAASRRTEQDLAAMQAAIGGMRQASRSRDVEAFAVADLAFHQAVMNAAGNEFIRALFDPVARLMHIGRMESSAPAVRRARAVRVHQAIMAAIAAGEPARAAAAMREHLDETLAWTLTASRRASGRNQARNDGTAHDSADREARGVPKTGGGQAR
jgi:GntR family transcriptional regulator, transcriptional repressor for pyruvate dehydrogenase complex